MTLGKQIEVLYREVHYKAWKLISAEAERVIAKYAELVDFDCGMGAAWFILKNGDKVFRYDLEDYEGRGEPLPVYACEVLAVIEVAERWANNDF